MGKGLLPDSHPLCIASARSAALKEADVVLVLGARLNWILHYGASPKWAPEGRVKWLKVDVKGEELDDNQPAEVGVVGDIRTVVEQVVVEVKRRRGSSSSPSSSSIRPLAHQAGWHKTLQSSAHVNTQKLLSKATSPAFPMNYHQAFTLIAPLLPRSHVFVGEGANTLDIGRLYFNVEEPRSRLDSGTTATMGVGMGFAIAAALVEEGKGKGRKVVSVVGDSAFGFSAMEVETAARNKLGILIIVMNNNGVSGPPSLPFLPLALKRSFKLTSPLFPSPSFPASPPSFLQVYHGLSTSAYTSTNLTSLPPTALLPDVRYDLLAEACGGQGFLVRTPDELKDAIAAGLKENEKPTLINLLMDPGKGGKLEFGWLSSTKKTEKAKL
jgi:2-hydroxyacyl-CoA lyase 1